MSVFKRTNVGLFAIFLAGWGAVSVFAAPLPPTVSISSSIPKLGEIKIGAGVTGSGVSSVAFFLDGALVKVYPSATPPYDYVFYATATTTGLHLGKAEAYNPVGTGTGQLNVLVDFTPPSVSIASPADGASVGSTLNITASASDATSGMAKVEFYVDYTLKASIAVPPYSFTLDTTQLSPAWGSHILQAKAFDVSGNASTSTYVGFQLTVAGPPVPTPTTNLTNSTDADGFPWGTESTLLISNFNTPTSTATIAQDAINNTVKTRFVKIRVTNGNFATTDGGTTYSPAGCQPSPGQCSDRFNMDETIKLFKANGWTLAPMISYDTTDTSPTSAKIDLFVNFVDWFVGRYKTDGGIQRIELENCPGSWWKGTALQLVELQNKVYDRIHTKYPDVLVGTPGFEYHGDTSGDGGLQGALAQVNAMLNPANGAKFDFWAYHGYVVEDYLGPSQYIRYAPTVKASTNPFSGVPGILEVRKALDANGWQNRPMFDTEHAGDYFILPPTDSGDQLEAAWLVQASVLEKTLRTSSGTAALAGVSAMKIEPKGASEFEWASLYDEAHAGGTMSKNVRAVSLLWTKLQEYRYSSHLSGAFDDARLNGNASNESLPWVEKFASGSKELYIFFKPFTYVSGQNAQIDGLTAAYSLTLSSLPTSAVLTDIDGNVSSVTPSQTIALTAVNRPQYLEVAYDLAPPSVSIVSPADGASAVGMMSVSIAASDDVGVTKIELSADGVFKSSASASSLIFALDTTQLAAGSHTLQAKAYDGAGHVTTSSDVHVTVPNGSPSSYLLVAPFSGGGLYKIDPSLDQIVSQISFSSNPGRPAIDVTRRLAYLPVADTVAALKADSMQTATLALSGLGKDGSFSSLSPDGKTLAVVNHGADGARSPDDRVDIVSLNPDVWPPTASLSFSVTVGQQPIRALFDRNGRYVVVSVRDDPTPKILVIDVTTHQTVTELDLTTGAEPEGMDLNPARNIMYVTLHGQNKIEVLDMDLSPPSRLAEVAIQSGKGPPSPSGGHATPDGSRLYISGQTTNEILLFDTSIATSPVQDMSVSLPSSQQPHDIAFFPDGRAYVANTYNTQQHGNITVIQNYATSPSTSAVILSDVIMGPLYFAYFPAVDVSSPAVSITSPSNGSTISGSTTVIVSASDDVGVTKVELYVDGVLKSSATSGPYSLALDALSLTVGSHSLQAKAYDAAGNMGASAGVGVIVSSATLSNSLDADGFLWGAEGSVVINDAGNLSSSEIAIRAAINGTLKTKYVKIRPQNDYFTSTDGGVTYSPSGCMPTPSSCLTPFNLDETVKLYKANGWSMVPMFTYDRSASGVTTADIDRFVNFVSWFVDRSKTDAGIQYIELEDFPASWWQGTNAQLLEMTNKIYDRIKASHPDVLVGTPGFEYWSDTLDATTSKAVSGIEYFLNPSNGAKFDYWAFHGYGLSESLGGGSFAFYPPTRTAAANKYAGIPGILEIRKVLDANSWQGRPIIDTEHFGVGTTMFTDSEDRLDAAYVVQHDLLGRTLRASAGAAALSGILSLKIFPRGSQLSEHGALNSDGSPSKHLKAVGLLRDKLHDYNYASRINGAFDDEAAPWVEKFQSTGTSRQLYVFFKPFQYHSGQTLSLDGQTLSYSLQLPQVPLSAVLTDVNGSTSSVTLSQTLALSAVNSPQYLEVTYTPDTTPPSVPSGLSATAVSAARVNLSWTSSTDNMGVAGYRIRRDGSVIVTTTTTAYFDTGLSSGTRYTYAVSAYDDVGNESSASSSVSTATWTGSPGAQALTGMSSTTLTLQWSANGILNGTSYYAQISTVSNFTPIFASSATFNTTAAFSGLSPNTTYYARTAAYSLYAGTWTAFTTLGSTLTYASPPLSPSLSMVGASSITLAWGPTSNPSGTWSSVELSSDGFVTINASSRTLSASATFTGLLSNATYQLRAQAFNSSEAATAYTAVLTTSTLAAAPVSAAPSGVSTSSITANWSVNGNRSGTLYTAQISTNGFATVNASSITRSSFAIFSGLQADANYDLHVRVQGNDGSLSPFVALPSTRTLLALPGSATTTFPLVALTSVTAQWTSGGNGAGTTYEAVISTDNFATVNASSVTKNLSAAFLGLGVDTTYYFQVRSANGQNSSTYLSLGSAVTLAYAPAGTAVLSVSSATVNLDWSANGNHEPGARYELWRDVSAAFVTPLLTTVSTSAATAAGLSPKTTYYFKVRAFNHAGVYTDFDSVVSTMTWPPAPGRPGTPAGSALGVSSMTWSWTAAQDGQTYKTYRASNTASLVASTPTLSHVDAGLSTNTAYGIVVAGSNPSGEGPLSLPATVYTLAAAPAGTAVSAVVATSATISWNLNTNPAGTTAELQRSTDNATFSTVRTGAFTSVTDMDLVGCTTYYARVRNRNGDDLPSAFDSTIQFKTIASTPLPPGSLAADSLVNNKIALSWQPSATEGIVQYRLYGDNGTGNVDYGAPLAVFTSTESSWTTGPMFSSAAYTFALRAKHRCGVEETGGVFALAGSTGTLANVRASIKAPDSGKRISGNRITVIAELSSGTQDQVQQVSFQSRPSGGGAWANLTAVEPVHPNPDVDAPYFIHVDVTGWASGSYDLRVVAVNIAGSSDTAPSAVTVTVDPISPDIHEDLGTDGKVEKRQTVSNAVTSTIWTAGSGSVDPVVKVVLPAGALTSSTITVTAVSNPTITTAPPSGFSFAGSAVEIDLSNGQSGLSGGLSAAVTLSFPSETSDPAGLTIQSLDPATGAWSAIGAPSVDTTNHSVTATTPHLSLFAVVSGGSAAADLSGVRVYPVPYKPNGGNPDEGKPYSAGDATSGIVFDRLPQVVSVKIYTLTGRLVAKFDTSDCVSGKIQWDAKNADGRAVASGGYFAVVASPGHKSVVKKLVIIR